jgi:hypothetical protein
MKLDLRFYIRIPFLVISLQLWLNRKARLKLKTNALEPYFSASLWAFT